jgi:hypothetical protein
MPADGVYVPVAVNCCVETVIIPTDPFAAAVIRPFPFTVILAAVKDPTFEFTVAKVVATAPDVITSPVRSAFVTVVPPENFVRFPVAGEPVVVTVPPALAAFNVVDVMLRFVPSVRGESPCPFVA